MDKCNAKRGTDVPVLNGPGTKCDASFFPLILDLKCVWTLDLSIFLSFEFRISGQSSVAPSRAAWASKDIRGDVPYISGQKIAHSRIAKRQGRRIGGRGDDDIASFTPLLLVFPHTRAMPSCISPSLNNSYSLFHIHPHVLNPLHRQRIPQPVSYPPGPPLFVFNLSRLRLSSAYDPFTQFHY